MPGVLICLDLLKYPNRGLGRVSIDFSKELIGFGRSDFDFEFLVPGNKRAGYLTGQQIVRLNNFRRVFPSYQKKYDVCHVIHQLPRFSYRNMQKMVLTVHDLNFLYTKNRQKQDKYRKIVQAAINKADAVCFISEFTRSDCYKHMDMPSGKVTKVIYNGVGDLPSPSQRPAWCPEGVFLFSVGQFLEKKNFRALIPFMAKVPGMSLVIAGENNTGYGNELKVFIQKNGLGQRVVLPGAISEAEKSFMYHNCKAFVFPSVAEGFGLPVIEAMKCGKPVFCSDKTSLKEIGGRYAFFWECFDPAHMAEVYEKGISEFNYRHKAAQMEYASSFRWEDNVKSYLEIYRQLI